ncbi:amino acid permease-domain-containing protein [Mycena epipterygia]|nr:amino acid permease-domain-containing protein [Mycena epipterygia]
MIPKIGNICLQEPWIRLRPWMKLKETRSATFGESFDNVPRSKRQLGLTSAVFLVFNRVIGTGIYATPSIILRTSGSVGVALLMWLLGALITAAGTAVYVEFGTGLPRNGGEKNYLEFIYRRPRFLVSCSFVAYTLIIGSAAANSIVFGEYILHTLEITPTRFSSRLVAILVLTFCLLVHGTLLKFGVRLQNTLGAFKLVILAAISLLGILSLLDVPGFAVRAPYEVPHNFQWARLWEGSGTGANGFVTALYSVIWSFIGYANANYALSEVRDPVRTIKRAAPLAMTAVTVVYMAVNVAYFAVVSKDDILGSRRIVAALFFRNLFHLFGPATKRAVSGFIALSTLGNLLAGQFTQGRGTLYHLPSFRSIQELGREGILPYASFFASNKPFGAPLAGLLTQYLVSVLFVLGPPPGDAYLFMISTSSYSLALINTLVSLGLLLLYTPAYRAFGWAPPFRAPHAVTVLFFLSNVFLVAVPLVPPAPGRRVYEHLPYWLHAAVALAVSLIGAAYWYVWGVWLPQRRGYVLEREWVLQDDGVPRYVRSSPSRPAQLAPFPSSFVDPHRVFLLTMRGELVATTHALRLHDYLFLVPITFLYWDHLMTFGDEVRFLWRKTRTPSTYCFLLNRYLAFLGDIVVAVFVFTTVPDSIIICVLLTLRIYALWRETKVWIYMLGAGGILIAVSLWAISGNGGMPVPGVDGCHIANSQNIGIHLAVPWEALFIYDVMIVVALLFKSFRTRNDTVTIRRDLPLLSLLIRDGSVYFVAMALVNLANIMTFYATGGTPPARLSIHHGQLVCPPSLYSWHPTSTHTQRHASLSVTMMSRLMLNLHAVESTGIFSTTAQIKYASPVASDGSSVVELDTLGTTDLERSAGEASRASPGGG